MKLKYLKTFENFGDEDMGRFSNMESDEQDWLNHIKGEESEEVGEEGEESEEGGCPSCGSHNEECPDCQAMEDEEEIEEPNVARRRVWGDEVIEKKKEKEEEKDSKKDSKKDSGLSAKQKKLPEGLRKAIEARKKKK